MTTIPSASAARRRFGLFLAPVVLLLLWLASGAFVPSRLGQRSLQLQGLVTTFLGIFIEALPFLLAGVAASIAIQRWVTSDLLSKIVGRSSIGGAVRGSLLGLLFPVCECGAIPASRRLLRKGAPVPLGIAFALAAPVVNPIVLLSTMVAFDDWRWAAGRVGLTILIAVLVALIVGAGIRRESLLAPAALLPSQGDDEHNGEQHDDHGHVHDSQCRHSPAPANSWRSLLAQGAVEFFEMSQYLILGGLLAATMQTFLPQSLLLNLTAEGSLGLFGPLAGVLVLMAVAVLLSVCSTIDAFLALAFLGLFHPGAVMAFLVFGPMIDIKSTLMLTSTFRKGAIVAMVVLAAQFSLLAGLAVYVLMR